MFGCIFWLNILPQSEFSTWRPWQPFHKNGRQQQLFSYKWWIWNDIYYFFTIYSAIYSKYILDHLVLSFNTQDGRHLSRWKPSLVWMSDRLRVILESNQSLLMMQKSNLELWHWPEASLYLTTEYDHCFFQNSSHMK